MIAFLSDEDEAVPEAAVEEDRDAGDRPAQAIEKLNTLQGYFIVCINSAKNMQNYKK